jgi:hypothetical protein
MEIHGPWTEYPERFIVTLSQASKQTPDIDLNGDMFVSSHNGRFKINTTLYVLSTEKRR